MATDDVAVRAIGWDADRFATLPPIGYRQHRDVAATAPRVGAY
jgi:hypothetical protein